jgi:hypothetical protein
MLRFDAGYHNWNRQLDALVQQAETMNASPMLATPAVYDNLNGMAREWQGTIKEFQADPRKFLRLKIF